MKNLDAETIHSLSKLFKSRFALLGMQLDGEQYQMALDTAHEMLDDINEVLHAIKLKQEMYASTSKVVKPEINQLIKVSRRHLGDLEDWVHIDKRDLQHASLYHLEESLSELAKLIRQK